MADRLRVWPEMLKTSEEMAGEASEREGAQGVDREAEEYARDLRLAVEAYASARRREAEDEARRIVAEAEARARELRGDAERQAAEVEAAARRRAEELRGECHALEERRRRALEGLQEIAAQLQDLLPQRRDEETLPEALSVKRRR